ncbi:acylphosphatase [Oceanobacillus luteolus]|uniref:Acylphosphatase n=1 Tax=Oceanobacillus luteolus TaxID=1274358 RepID=A0ABW4HVN2_9BACI
MEKRWLSHLEGCLPTEARGYPVSMYSIALEGWRRGLSVKFENNNRVRSVIRYSLSDGVKTHYFMGSRGDLVTKEAMRITGDKSLTKKYLAEAGVMIAQGQVFDENVDDDTIIDYAVELGFPVVIKPISAAGGRGVIANIKDKDGFLEAVKYVRNDLNYKEVIVEKHVDGLDYRVYVVGNKVIGAINRIPANVMGDGKKTINQLLQEKNKEKKKNPALTDSPIKKDDEMMSLLKEQGYTLDSVPPKGKRVYLKSKSNISAGGEPIDATDQLTEEVKKNAIKAVNAIPGLAQSGVDILWDSATNDMAVIELNNIPSIRTHLFPLEGQARDVPKAIVDHYFPNSEANHRSPLYYFDIGDIFRGFTNNELKEVAIPNHPKGELISKHLVVSNVKNRALFMKKNFKLAKSLLLNGFINSLNKNKVEILVSGQIDKVNNYIDTITASKTVKVKESNWDKPVKLGFERLKKESSKTSSKKKSISSSSDIEILRKEFKRLEKERDFYKKKYHSVSNSKVWRLANVLRKIKS